MYNVSEHVHQLYVDVYLERMYSQDYKPLEEHLQ